LIDELYRQELIEARAMSPEDKVLAGQQLFEAACRITLAGISHQFPDASPEQCREILRRRLDLQRKLEASSPSHVSDGGRCHYLIEKLFVVFSGAGSAPSSLLRTAKQVLQKGVLWKKWQGPMRTASRWKCEGRA
jgi:hypothetical protein